MKLRCIFIERPGISRNVSVTGCQNGSDPNAEIFENNKYRNKRYIGPYFVNISGIVSKTRPRNGKWLDLLQTLCTLFLKEQVNFADLSLYVLNFVFKLFLNF